MTERKRDMPETPVDTLKEEAFSVASEQDLPVGRMASVEHRARLRHELLNKEIDLFRARLEIIRSQIGVLTRSSMTWADASARTQLGPYPWAKFLALSAGPYLVTKALRRLPIGSVIAVAIPLVTAVVKQRGK